MERLNTGYLSEQYKGLGIIEFKCYSMVFLFIDLIMFLIDSRHDLNESFFILFYGLNKQGLNKQGLNE